GRGPCPRRREVHPRGAGRALPGESGEGPTRRLTAAGTPTEVVYSIRSPSSSRRRWSTRHLATRTAPGLIPSSGPTSPRARPPPPDPGPRERLPRPLLDLASDQVEPPGEGAVVRLPLGGAVVLCRLRRGELGKQPLGVGPAHRPRLAATTAEQILHLVVRDR